MSDGLLRVSIVSPLLTISPLRHITSSTIPPSAVLMRRVDMGVTVPSMLVYSMNVVSTTTAIWSSSMLSRSVRGFRFT